MEGRVVQRLFRIGLGSLVLAALVGCAGGPADPAQPSDDPGGASPPDAEEAVLEVSASLQDGSPLGAGEPGPDAPYLIVCGDPAQSVYDSPDPEGLAAAERGDIIACADDGFWPAQGLASRAEKAGLVMQNGVRRLRVAYRTERSPGIPGISAASILVPQPAPSQSMDLVVVAHGTTGLADHCAPSRYAGYFDPLALAFVSQGYVVVSPDYAGLGTEGVQGYGDAVDTAHSLLDAPAAVRGVLAPESLSDRNVVVGYSQGAGAALNVHGLADSYGMAGNLSAVVAFAGTVITSPTVDPEPFEWAGYIQANYGYGASAAFGSLMLYSHGANNVAPPTPGVFFHEDHRDQIMEWVETLCIGDIIAEFSVFDDALMFDDVFSPAFYDGVLSCLNGTGVCDPLYGSYVQRIQDGYIPVDPDGPRILLHAGSLDAIVQPQKIACTRDALEAWGQEPTTCVNPEAGHGTVVDSGVAHGVAWVTSVLAGDDPPPCPNPWATLPACDG